MHRRSEAKLRKAIRNAEHRLRGLRAAVARRDRAGTPFGATLRQFVVDRSANRDHRQFIATLLWRTRGARDACRSMFEGFANAAQVEASLEYLRLCDGRKSISPRELSLFRHVRSAGKVEDQVWAVDLIAFIRRRPVRRVLIDLMFDTSAPMDARERATEMLHVHDSKETAEACAKALNNSSVTIRFWAAYTLGNICAYSRVYRHTVVSALERVLEDDAVAPGWWSVGREAQAMIAGVRHLPNEREQLQAEIRRIKEDPNASAEDKRWAECYCI